MKKLLALALLAAVPAVYALAGEIEALYREQPGTEPLRLGAAGAHRGVDAEDHGISEIGLERTACLGSCPMYSVVISADGTFRYHGEWFVPRLGDHSGRVDRHELRRVLNAVRDLDFLSLEDSYTYPWTCGAIAYTTVVLDGKRKVVRNYAESGPARLWVIERLVDGLLERAQWAEK